MFNKILDSIVEETGGGIGAILMGYDGIAIEQVSRDVEGLDLSLVTVEFVSALQEIRKAVEILKLGNLEEVTIKTDKFQTIVRVLNQEYFIALTVDDQGNLGKGRYLLSREKNNLLAALG
ncbi:MAG: roadblock/LC7 domain-containing protein [Deltaproteobacteria bacterium]|nr:roadblock/LC7 domain-containing protein [Deltaproteobacteria bacterium]